MDDYGVLTGAKKSEQPFFWKRREDEVPTALREANSKVLRLCTQRKLPSVNGRLWPLEKPQAVIYKDVSLEIIDSRQGLVFFQ
jgi:hypothetical protein